MNSKKSVLDGINGKYSADVLLRAVELMRSGVIPDIPPEFVFGDGNGDEPVMLVGEAPGKDEVRYGRPFVGAAGKILDHLLESSGIDRRDLYITNTVKYRLARSGRRPGTYANRPVKSIEIDICSEWLCREIAAVAPALIITLGNTALSGVRRALGYSEPSGTVGALHGNRYELQYEGGKCILIPLYHPASLIYNPDKKNEYEEDLEEVKKCAQSIS